MEPFNHEASAARPKELKDDIHSTAEQTGKQAEGMLKSATLQTCRVAEQQEQAGAQQVSAIARAVDGAADQLEHEMPQASEFMHDMHSASTPQPRRCGTRRSMS